MALTKTRSSVDRIDGDSEARVWQVETNRTNTGDVVKLQWRKPDGTVDIVTGAVNGSDDSIIDWAEPADYFKTATVVRVAYWSLQSLIEIAGGGEIHGKPVAVPIVAVLA